MLKVMIVDDVLVMRYTIKNILEDLGYNVVAQAENGYDAIEKFKTYKPDIVTMDITMPAVNGVENGVEALKEIKKLNSNASVIMLTSHGEQKLVIDAVTSGAKGYILKPITKEKIEDTFGKIALQ